MHITRDGKFGYWSLKNKQYFMVRVCNNKESTVLWNFVTLYSKDVYCLLLWNKKITYFLWLKILNVFFFIQYNIFSRIYLFIFNLERGTKPMLTPHNSQYQFSLSGIRTYDHPHASPKLYHCYWRQQNVLWYGNLKA